MAKQTSSVDVVIKAHDKASKKFAAIGRTFTMMTGKVFAFGLKENRQHVHVYDLQDNCRAETISEICGGVFCGDFILFDLCCD